MSATSLALFFLRDDVSTTRHRCWPHISWVQHSTAGPAQRSGALPSSHEHVLSCSLYAINNIRWCVANWKIFQFASATLSMFYDAMFMSSVTAWRLTLLPVLHSLSERTWNLTMACIVHQLFCFSSAGRAYIRLSAYDALYSDRTAKTCKYMQGRRQCLLQILDSSIPQIYPWCVR